MVLMTVDDGILGATTGRVYHRREQSVDAKEKERTKIKRRETHWWSPTQLLNCQPVPYLGLFSTAYGCMYFIIGLAGSYGQLCDEQGAYPGGNSYPKYGSMLRRDSRGTHNSRALACRHSKIKVYKIITGPSLPT